MNEGLRNLVPSTLLRRSAVAAVSAAAAVLLMAAAGEPVFLRWLDPTNPGDATILVYWERVKSGEASPAETVDLGTMLFHRGFPNDAAQLYRDALDRDPNLAGGWLHLGLVEHDLGHLRAAERAYRRCLKVSPHQPWCEFYLGRLLEQTGRKKEALEHYRAAFSASPDLADPEKNPEVLSSRLALGARLRSQSSQRFVDTAPLPFVEPNAVSKTMRPFLPTATPTATPAPTAAPEPPAGPAAAGRRIQPEQARPGTRGSRPPVPEAVRPTPPEQQRPRPVPPEVVTTSGTAVFRPR